MSENRDESQDHKSQHQTQPSEEPQLTQPSPSPTGTMYNLPPSGSTANPQGGQTQFVNFLQSIQSMNYQKETNPEISLAQTQAVMSLSENLKEENLRQIDYQESRDVKQHDIITKREGRDFKITLCALGTVIVIVGVGVYLLIEGQTVAGTGLLAGGLGTILGFLGGMGNSKRVPV